MAEYRIMSEDELRQRTRALLAEIHPEKSDSVSFRRAQFAHGLAWVHFPEGHGGLGLPPKMNLVVHDEITRHSKVVHGDPPASTIGIGMGAPVVLTYGSEEMKKRLLSKIFTGEEIWCQLFSEPSAGSDVAGLATRAVRDGNDWILNGQKVWTTVAHLSRWGMLLARTNPDAPKHDGLSYFVLDMHAPGVSVRPLYQITGEAEFNEVFLTDVRIPQLDDARKRGAGLARRDHDADERARRDRRRGVEAQGRRREPAAARALEGAPAWRTHGGSGGRAARPRDALLHRHRARAPHRAARARCAEGGQPRPGGLGLEARDGRDQQTPLGDRGRRARCARRSRSKRATSGASRRASAQRASRLVKYQFLRSRANSIEGGTSEIMRNILGERVLGLPGEPRVDKDVPWKDVPR